MCVREREKERETERARERERERESEREREREKERGVIVSNGSRPVGLYDLYLFKCCTFF